MMMMIRMTSMTRILSKFNCPSNYTQEHQLPIRNYHILIKKLEYHDSEEQRSWAPRWTWTPAPSKAAQISTEHEMNCRTSKSKNPINLKGWWWGRAYGFGGVPRADEGDGAVDVGNEVAVGLVVLHLEGDVQLAAFVVVDLVVPGVGAAVALGGAGAHCFGRRGRKIGGGQLRGCITKVHPTSSNWIMKRDPHPHIFHPLSSFFLIYPTHKKIQIQK